MKNKNLVQEWPYKSKRIPPGQDWTPRCTQNTSNHWGSLQLEIHRWRRALNMMKFGRHRMWRWGHRIPLKNNVTKLIDLSFARIENRIKTVDSVYYEWSGQLHLKAWNSVTLKHSVFPYEATSKNKLFFVPTPGISTLPSGTNCKLRIFFFE